LEVGSSKLSRCRWGEHHGNHVLIRERPHRLGIEGLTVDIGCGLVNAKRAVRAVEPGQILNREEIPALAEASGPDDQIPDAPCRRFYDDTVDVPEFLFVAGADFQVG
jgi:hypothetical protein